MCAYAFCYLTVQALTKYERRSFGECNSAVDIKETGKTSWKQLFDCGKPNKMASSQRLVSS